MIFHSSFSQNLRPSKWQIEVWTYRSMTGPTKMSPVSTIFNCYMTNIHFQKAYTMGN